MALVMIRNAGLGMSFPAVSEGLNAQKASSTKNGMMDLIGYGWQREPLLSVTPAPPGNN